MTPKTPNEIVGGVNRKEGWAITLVWNYYEAGVNKLISRFLGQTPFNQDFAADALAALIQTKDHIAGMDQIRRFLNQTTINICRDHRKKMSTQEDHEDRLIYHYRSMEEDDIEIAESIAYQQMLIHIGIAKIPGKCGHVCHLHHIKKMSGHEIARQLGMSEKTVGNHLSAGNKFLKMNRQNTRRYFEYPLIIFLLIYLYENL